jgi:DNA-binding transcriptional MerR regulator
MNTSKLDLITRKEAVKILRISESTLDRWSKIKLLRKYKVRGRVFYKENELEQLISENEII